MPPIARADREHIVEHAKAALQALTGANLFITGGTGFYGKWLLESVAAANDLLDTRIRATILSRDPGHFAHQTPHLAKRREFLWLTGTTTNFACPARNDGNFDCLLDFATPSAAEVGAGGTALIEHALAGTAHLIEFARRSGIQRVLYASSGAVYGHGPAGYGELKRRSETAWRNSHIPTIITRGYAFIGPYLPLSDKFAVGSFIRDALAGGPIRVTGNGTAIRSYLYGADLAANLLNLLCQGSPSTPHQLGSMQSVTIRELAQHIARHTGTRIETQATSTPLPAAQGTAYLPDQNAGNQAHGMVTRIDLDSAISRNLDWASLCHPGSSLREGSHPTYYSGKG